MQVAPPTSLMQQFAGARTVWFSAILPVANTLFGLLASVEIIVAGIMLALEKADFQIWVATFLRKMLWIGAFYTLLLLGPQWIPTIIDSFALAGARAAGTNAALSPASVFDLGLNIAGSLFAAGSDAGFFTHLGVALSLTLAAVAVILSFTGLCLALMMALIESYILVGAGVIFLGFGGSRWTVPYVERYFGLAVHIGIKLFCLELLVGLGMQLANGWIATAQAIAQNADPGMSAWSIAGSSIILAVVCWGCSKLIASVVGGSPAFSGADLVAPVLAGSQVALAGAAMGAGTAAAISGAAAHRPSPPPPSGPGPAGSPPSSSGPPLSPAPAPSYGPGVSPTNAGAVNPPAPAPGAASRPSSVPPPSGPSAFPAMARAVAQTFSAAGMATAKVSQALGGSHPPASPPSMNL